MTLLPGTRLGSYEVSAKLGEGGMGEVYRATDSNLKRQVAIKVLPASVAADADHLARFQREAEVLAALNHPNIAHIHGVEKSSGVFALVMELVEGPTLADRIARGAVPLDEALPIARQIADALEAAHDQGIIHRDLKPANIKVRPDGTVKVLDFGLAKAIDPAAASSGNAVNSPTISVHATQAGIILGTAAYMSPEQASGKTVDKRSDLWSFGVVLLEMLTGRRVFDGETVSHTIASVLKDSPDLSLLPADTPAPIRKLLRRCLEKDRKRRLADAADARFEIEEAMSATVDAPMVPMVKSGPRVSLTVIAAVALIVLTAGVAGTVVSNSWRTTAVGTLARLSVLPPADTTIFVDSGSAVISPDGQWLALVTGNATFSFSAQLELYVRRIDAVDAMLIKGASGAVFPFWSPDSRQIAFFAEGKLKRVDIASGRIDEVCDAKDGRGGAWSADGVIVFAPANASGLMRVAASGGTPQVVTTVDAEHGQTSHRYPVFLADGRHFLYAALPAHDAQFDIWAASLDGGAPEKLLAAESAPVYAKDGYLLFSRKAVLVAQRFDSAQRKLIGEPVMLDDHPGAIGDQFIGAAAATAADNGTLAYLSNQPVQTTLKWFDQQGREAGAVSIPPAQYNQVRVSPDVRSAALTRRAGTTSRELWIADLLRGGATPLVEALGLNYFPAWAPSSDRIAFASSRNGPADIFAKSLKDASPDEPVLKSAALFKFPQSWSPDGNYVLYDDLNPATNNDIWLLPMTGTDRTPRPYLRTAASESSGTISPDGRWILYLSDETGRQESYVQSFPTPGRKFRITSTGASAAWWRKDGSQILIASTQLTDLRVADVIKGGEFSTTVPRIVGHLPKGVVSIDATQDLQRVLALVTEGGNSTLSVTVVQNWQAALALKK